MGETAGASSYRYQCGNWVIHEWKAMMSEMCFGWGTNGLSIFAINRQMFIGNKTDRVKRQGSRMNLYWVMSTNDYSGYHLEPELLRWWELDAGRICNLTARIHIRHGRQWVRALVFPDGIKPRTLPKKLKDHRRLRFRVSFVLSNGEELM